MSSFDRVKEQKREMILRHAQADNVRALAQVLTALIGLTILWWLAVQSVDVSHWLTALAIFLISLFALRLFVLMHECGHGSLFRTQSLNRGFGFVLGVISGMPQYVWSKHHNFHHAHNGDWDKYRGLYTTLSVDEYEALTETQQLLYRLKCSIAAAPIAGLIYVIFNPRFNWLKCSMGLLSHIVKGKVANPGQPIHALVASYETRYWQSPREYWHMTWNNVALLSIWAMMCWACGAGRFFTIYLISTSMAGAAGIILFTVQHNFAHSYASETRQWDYDMGAIEGSEFSDFTALAELVHRQYRLSSRSPPVGQNSQLLPGRLPQRICVSVSGRHPRDVVANSRSLEVHSVGQAHAADHFDRRASAADEPGGYADLLGLFDGWDRKTPAMQAHGKF